MYLKLVNNIAANINMPPYISNGLVFQLDGINTGMNRGVWTDLVGGIIFNIGPNVVRGDKYFEFLATSYTAEDIAIGNKSMPSDFPSDFENFTIEFVASIDAGATIQYIFNGGINNAISLAWANGLITPAKTRQPRYDVGNIKSLATFSWTYDYAYRNGIAGSRLGTDYWNPPAEAAQIGGTFISGNARNFCGRLYALRIYDRKLTIDEILHNQQLDIERFGIQL